MNYTELLVAHIRRTLGELSVVQIGDEYEYASLPLCVIDAVYSLGVRYESVQRTVQEWCTRYDWPLKRSADVRERGVSEFLQVMEPYENRWEEMANDVFRNMQRTSTRGGIRKAEAVYHFARTLQQFGVETFEDAKTDGLRDDLRQAITSIRGQGSGLSFNYFLILAGNTDAVKADRMVIRFVSDALGLKYVEPERCERLVREASAALKPEFTRLTPASLDSAIWNYQRRQTDVVEAPCGQHK